MSKFVMSIDAGTTGIRVILFNKTLQIKGNAYKEFRQFYPHDGWVEHDPEEIWKCTKLLIRRVFTVNKLKSSDIEAIGITNQRETTVIWEKKTGKPVYKAIVWQCRRTADLCEDIKSAKFDKVIKKKTGFVVDAYFSATKIQWILKNVPGAASKAKRGQLLFGTIDTWILYKLTAGDAHKTDFTNASRTMLFNIKTKKWDKDICAKLNIPLSLLPDVHPSSDYFGVTVDPVKGIPITGMAGDQQAAAFGQGCVKKGTLKHTYGTGGFLLLNIGDKPLYSKRGLLTTICCDRDGNPAYSLEGSIFIAGAVMQWLRDKVNFFKDAAQSEKIALKEKRAEGLFLIPAFVGLGAPYWDMYARGSIMGLTRDTGISQIVRAALESIAFQTRDLVDIMESDGRIKIKKLRVDGGATANNYLMQFQADILNCIIEKPKILESTALGAAILAGLKTGYWKKIEDALKVNTIVRSFKPAMKPKERNELYSGWKKAVRRILT